MFNHLKETDGACLSEEAYHDFCKYVRPKKQSKVLVLYGYIPWKPMIKNGREAAEILVRAIAKLEKKESAVHPNGNDDEEEEETRKFSRSYGHDQRGVEIVAQDEDTGAITEVMALRMQPLKNEESVSAVNNWLDKVQQILDQQFSSLSTVPIRVLGRQPMNHAKFNAEMDVTNRRVEYLLPVDFLSWSDTNVQQLLDSAPSFNENHKGHKVRAQQEETRPEAEIRNHLYKLKKIMQKLSTQIIQLDINDKSAVLEKGFSLQKRKGQLNKKSNRKKKKKGENNESSQEATSKVTNALVNSKEKHGILKRKRFHNFTETVMAHEYLAYRRLDRMYHRATLRFPDIDPLDRPFIVLSITGDMFLTGQVLRVVGLFLALANGLLGGSGDGDDTDFIDCVFDEDYPHLIPTVPVLPMGMMASEATYMTWEGMSV